MSMADRLTSTEVAQEAETVRADLAHTLDQLRENLKPQNVIEDVVDTARVGVNSLADGLFGLAREYPLPSLLIGAGCAMIMGFGSTIIPHRRKLIDLQPAPDGTPARNQDADAALSRGSSPSTFAEIRIDHADAIGTEAEAPVPYRKGQVWPVDTGSDLENERRMRPDATNRSSEGLNATFKVGGMIHEQPLIIAALGLAVGAAIGASLPSTKVEDQWMGDISSSVKRSAQDAARHELEDLKAVARQTRDNSTDSAPAGFSAANLDGTVRDAAKEPGSATWRAGRPA